MPPWSLFVRQKGHKLLEIQGYGTDDLKVTVSRKSLVERGLLHFNFAWLHCKGVRRIFLIEACDEVEDGKVLLSAAACDAMSACVGDHATLCKGPVPMIDSMVLYPVPATRALAGCLVSDYIYPHFIKGIRPVHACDIITIGHGGCRGTFHILNTTPSEYGLVTPGTKITLAQRVGEEGSGYGAIMDPLECALELQRNVDYISPEWCGETVAELSKGLQKLVHLLQAPPLYKG